jgi:hypothetical protein
MLSLRVAVSNVMPAGSVLVVQTYEPLRPLALKGVVCV